MKKKAAAKGIEQNKQRTGAGTSRQGAAEFKISLVPCSS
jgi:hypothetical protein